MLNHVITLFTLNFCIEQATGDIFRGHNVVLVNDLNSWGYLFGKKLISEILNKLPLDQNRVSLYSTNGISQQFQDFQSRACLMKILTDEQPRQRSLLATLKIAQQEIEADFNDEKNIVIVIVDNDLPESILEFLRNTRISTLNVGIYILYVGKKLSKLLSDKETGFHWISVNSTAAIKHLPFLRANRQLCSSGPIALDECKRQCDCIDSKLVNCRRVRKEFSAMSKDDRDLFLKTLKEFSVNRKYSKVYDQFVEHHQKHFWSGIHEPAQFYPWHRSYILKFENLLRIIDCRVTIPVWNWAHFSDVVWKSTPTYHMWDNDGGFGSDGVKDMAYCVGGGIFSAENWQTSRFEDREAVSQETCITDEQLTVESNKCIETSRFPLYSRCLRRRFNGNVPNISEVLDVINRLEPKEFFKFERTVRQIWHNLIHKRIGGHMQTKYASYSPEFWSHHAMVDAIWSKWQEKCKECMTWGFPGSVERLIGFNHLTYRHDYLNISLLGGCGIQVTYDRIFETNK